MIEPPPPNLMLFQRCFFALLLRVTLLLLSSNAKAKSSRRSQTVPVTSGDAGIHIGVPIRLPHANTFIQHVNKMLTKNPNKKLVLFTGGAVKSIFDPKEISKGVSLNGKTNARSWGDVNGIIAHSASSSNRSVAGAVHLHNELMIGDFLELFNFEYRRQQSKVAKKEKRHNGVLSKVEFDSVINKTFHPVVMTNTADENWGFLSTPIGRRTAKWVNMTNHLRIHHSSYDTVQYLLQSDKLVLLVANTHVDPMIGAHDKIICLPLGAKSRGTLVQKVAELINSNITKTRLLLINNSGWGERTLVNEIVSANFNGTVRNSYDTKSGRDHYRDLAESVFVLCPSGLGFDTYRLWETLTLGSIPILESNAGFDRTFSNLPVLVVRNYSDVTPALLETAYRCFTTHAHKYRYVHLLEQYWIGLVRRAVKTGQITHVKEQHPFRNKYCDFLSE